jgi:alpha-beta hydrolase superfamily lysophospholipase
MSTRLVFAFLLALLPAFARAAAPEPVNFPAADGVVVHGDLYRPGGPPRGVLLLFHQAAASRAEYAPIAPKLAALGWLALAIDQRSGGGYFGGHNLTAAGVRGDQGYMAALPDLEAALAFARAQWPAWRPAVWGSSYSAALVFLLAARHQADISAVLAFSPGEYLSGASVAAAAARVAVPIYVTSASDPDEVSAAAEILAASPAKVKRQHRAAVGVHGSATLRADSNTAGAEANFADVTGWLAALPGQAR